MILAINSKSREQVSIALWSDKVKKESSWKPAVNQSQKPLQNINQFLKKNKVKLKDLKAIAVSQGPGSYTSLRVGISVANTLAWSLDIPIIGVKTKNSKLKLPHHGSRKNYNLKLKTGEISALEIAKQAEKIITKKKPTKFQNIVIPYYSTRLN